MDLAALRRAYPEFQIRSAIAFKEGLKEELILAAEGDAPAFEITVFEGRLHAVIATSPRIVGPFGERVGLPFEDLPIEGAESCFAMAEGSPYTACPSTRTPGLQFLFELETPAPKPGDRVRALRLY